MAEGVGEDRVAVARATSCFKAAFAESESLADPKLRGFFMRLYKELAGAACFPFARGAGRRMWRWSMCLRPSFGQRQRKQLWAVVLQGMGLLRINFANKSAFPKLQIGQARSEELAIAAGLPWLVEPSAAMELVLPSDVDRGKGSILRV